MGKNTFLFIIPCYNEALNIEKVVLELKSEFPDADILIVNDASKDNSLEVIKNLGVAYLNLPFNLGYSGALQAGFKYAEANGYDFLVQFDGDGQHIASEAGKLINVFHEFTCDIVIGSRFLLNSGYKHGLLKTIGTSLFTMLIKLICNETISDPTSGFQVLSKRTISRYSKMNNYPEFPDANLIIEMLILGYKIKEVPVKMRLREFGVSMHSGFWRPVKYMIGMFYSIFMIILNYAQAKFHGK